MLFLNKWSGIYNEFAIVQMTAVKNVCNNSYKIFGNSKPRQLSVQIESPLPYGI